MADTDGQNLDPPLAPVVARYEAGTWHAAIFDFRRNDWVAFPNFAGPGGPYAAILFDGRRLIATCGKADQFFVVLYDLRKKKWIQAPEAPIGERNFGTVTLVGGKMIAWGGHGGAQGQWNDGAALSLSTLQWEKLPEAPLEARERHGDAVVGGKLYLWGGQGKGGSFADGACYDPRARMWEKLPDAPISGRISFSMAAIGRKIVIWSGGDKLRSDGAIYDTQSKSWEKISGLSLGGRRYARTTRSANALFMWGGLGGAVMNDGAEFSGRDWKVLPAAPIEGRYDPGVLWCSGKLYVWGGYLGNDDTQATDGAIYDPRTAAWAPMPKMPFGSNAWGVFYPNR